MLLPPLTEAWASAYFQLLFGLFVFSLSVPTLLLQLVDEDIRWVVHKRMKHRHSSLAACILFIPALLFIWWAHPTQNQVLYGWQTLIAHGLITLVPVFLAVTGPFVLSKFRREGLIQQLEKGAEKEFKKYQRLGRYRSIKNKSLADLIHLGKYGKPGHEKRLVLDALDIHVATVQAADNYDGDEFEAVIRGITTIIGGDDHVGNDENFAQAANVFSRIRDGCFNRPNLATSKDATLLLKAIIELGAQAIQTTSEETAEQFLELAAKCPSKTVFEFGLTAFQSKRYRIAVEALYKLELMAQEEEQKPPAETDERLATIYLLGLAAHLAACDGAVRKRAEQSFMRLIVNQSKPVAQLIDEASNFYYLWSHFETANNIEALRLGAPVQQQYVVVEAIVQNSDS